MARTYGRRPRCQPVHHVLRDTITSTLTACPPRAHSANRYAIDLLAEESVTEQRAPSTVHPRLQVLLNSVVGYA